MVLSHCHVADPPIQGRGPSTHAYTHALETGHHMFMKLEDGLVRGGRVEPTRG